MSEIYLVSMCNYEADPEQSPTSIIGLYDSEDGAGLAVTEAFKSFELDIASKIRYEKPLKENPFLVEKIADENSDIEVFIEKFPVNVNLTERKTDDKS